MLFDHEICRPQCYACNCLNYGRAEVFAYKMIKVNGLEWWENKLINSNKTVKFLNSDIEEKIEWLKGKIEELG